MAKKRSAQPVCDFFSDLLARVEALEARPPASQKTVAGIADFPPRASTANVKLKGADDADITVFPNAVVTGKSAQGFTIQTTQPTPAVLWIAVWS